MNVIYVHSHDTGRQITPYGLNAETPNLQELADQGIVFRQAFSMAPTCSPSRSALLTGMAPHSNGMLGLAHRGFRLYDYHKHLVRYLNAHGYETALSGVQHEARDVKDIGYQKIIGQLLESKRWDSGHLDDLDNAQHVAQFIKERHDAPYFLSFGLFSAHRPFPDVGVDETYVMPPFPLPDVPQTREDYARFLGSVKILDECVGMVLEALKESGEENNTLVVFTTDHGPAFPGMKCTLYDTGIAVSMIVKIPESSDYHQVGITDALISQIDIFPTLCDVLSIPQPSWIQGKSFGAFLRGKPGPVRNEIFAEVNYHAAYEPMRCIRTERYKFIVRYGTAIIPANIDDSPSKDFLFHHGYGLMREGYREELYDLYMDPMERVNVIELASYQNIYQDLRNRLKHWMINTQDPLLSGEVAKPSGALVNAADCYSPDENKFE